jgi:hypothetical protein
MKTCGDWRYSSTILDLGTSWRLVVSFTAKQLSPGGKIPFSIGYDAGWALCRRKKYLKKLSLHLFIKNICRTRALWP